MPDPTTSQKLMRTTNEDLSQKISSNAFREWVFRTVVLAFLAVIGFMGKALLSDVKDIPVKLNEQIATLRLEIHDQAMKEQRDTDTKISFADWNAYHQAWDSRVSQLESKSLVFDNKLEGIVEQQRKTTTAVEALDRTLTGFQIDFNTARTRLK